MPPGQRQTVTVPYVAPVPVGHRVELRYFNEAAGVFKKHKVLNPHLPLIRDLDSGVEYANMDHYKKVRAMSANPMPPNDYPPTPRSDLDWVPPVTARVVSCRVLTETFGDAYQVQTTLVVEVEP